MRRTAQWLTTCGVCRRAGDPGGRCMNDPDGSFAARDGVSMG